MTPGPRSGRARERTLVSGQLGTFDLVFFVVAAAAPLTVVAGVVPLAIRVGGVSAAYGYIIPGVILILFAVSFTAMSPQVKNAGAFYSYISLGLGKPLGVAGSFVAMIAYNAMTVCLIAGFSVYANNTLASLLGVDVPWPCLAGVCLTIILVLGYFKVTLSARVLGLALILEVLVLLIYQVGVIVAGGNRGFDTAMFDPGVTLDPGFGAMLVLTAGGFIGFEATAIYAEEVRDPRRTVPRATYIAIGFLAGFYTFSVWCLFIAFGTAEAVTVAAGDEVDTMTFVSMSAYVGQWLAGVGQVLLVTSVFAAALAFHNAAARYHFTMAREGLLPSLIARISTRHGSPVGGVLLQGGIACVVIGWAALAGADPYRVVFLWSAAPGVIGILILEAVTALAVIAHFRRDRGSLSVWRVQVAPALAALGLTVLIVLCLSHLELLTAAAPIVNVLIMAPVFIAAAFGVIEAVVLRRRRPQVYARLGAHTIDET